MNSTDHLLKIEQLKVDRGGVQVIDIPSFSINREEKVAVIGPNGAGKSSFLLSIATLIPRIEGNIIFSGSKVKPCDEVHYRRKVAMLFQEPLLFDTTVIDNVAEGLKICKTDKNELKRRAEESLELLGISHLAGRSARKLSGGEAQRVSLARAFALKPDLILMDEPFSSLDLPTRIALAEDLGQILHQSKTAAIIATHDRIEAFHIVERLMVMDSGRIIQEGTPKEVISNPGNDFVAAFRRTSYSGILI